MKMTEHTKEPWRIEPATKKDNWRTVGANNQVVSIFCGAMDMENARRIVACVNACRGLQTVELERNGLVAAVGAELLEADRKLERLLEAFGFIAGCENDWASGVAQRAITAFYEGK